MIWCGLMVRRGGWRGRLCRRRLMCVLGAGNVLRRESLLARDRFARVRRRRVMRSLARPLAVAFFLLAEVDLGIGCSGWRDDSILGGMSMERPKFWKQGRGGSADFGELSRAGASPSPLRR